MRSKNLMYFTSYILDVLTDSVYPAKISIKNGIFDEIIPIANETNVDVDVEGLMLPGFIDSHIHIESSMLIPSQFAKIAVVHGVTSAVCDPHEIANVCGLEGVDFMIDDASKVPFNFYFTAPSCVPVTLCETSGAVLGPDEIDFLLKRDEIVALGEMMNFPGVIDGDEDVLRKLELARRYGKPVDGHAPLISGEKLDKYIEQGISTDHECSNFREAIEKKEKGMKIMVREGSSAKNMEALFDFNKRLDYWKNQDNFGTLPNEILEKKINSPIFDFIITDDKHPNDLIKGYLDELIIKAKNLEVDVIKAIEMVTINPAVHYNLNKGAIIAGSKADFVIIDNLDEFNILKTYINGKCVYDGENVLFEAAKIEYKNSIITSKKQPDDFEIKTTGNECKVNVIKAYNGELLTTKTLAKLKVTEGKIQPDIKKDVLKIAVVERYGENTICNGFIKGFNLKKGAIASSVAHDSHNIIVIGCDSKTMADAVNTIIDNKGGFSVVSDNINYSLPLPIAGLMTDEDAFTVSEKLNTLNKMVSQLGCDFDSPFMTMSFMSLPVIPFLKITDKGLFDGYNDMFLDVIKN